MGLGGYLTWTAAFHEMHNKLGKKILPGEVHGNTFYPKVDDIFLNNPSIEQSNFQQSNAKNLLLVALNNPATNYCKQDLPDRAIQRFDKHIILQILEYFNAEVPLKNLKCRIYFTEGELREIDRILEEHNLVNKKFLTIDPHSNTEYTVNKEYPFHKWQLITDELSKDYTIVQIGQPNKKVLNNAINLTCKTTFRIAAGIIGCSELLLSTEGGLIHAATAVDTQSLVIMTGYIHPDMVAYPCNANIWVHGNHGPCGMKRRCEECWSQVSAHNHVDVIQKSLELLENKT